MIRDLMKFLDIKNYYYSYFSRAMLSHALLFIKINEVKKKNTF